MYDEIEYTTEFDLDVRSEVIYATFKETTLLPTPLTRTTPVFTTLNIEKSDYSDFWDFTQMRLDEFKSLLNDDVFGVGVPLPYWKLSLLSKLSFSPHNMGVISELYYNKSD